MEHEHNGIRFLLTWKIVPGWKPSWWVRVDGNEFPCSDFGRHGESDADAAAAFVRDTYIGDPPPPDHASIWGEYKCFDCGALGVRLWRDYQTCLDGQTLRCRSCACVHQGKPATWMSPHGGDQIGWLVPAVPTADGQTFWGYTSAPLVAVKWWQSLPG